LRRKLETIDQIKKRRVRDRLATHEGSGIPAPGASRRRGKLENSSLSGGEPPKQKRANGKKQVRWVYGKLDLHARDATVLFHHEKATPSF